MMQLKQNLKYSSKDCEHSVVQLTRPVKLRRTGVRSRQSLRASIIYRGPVQFVTQQSEKPLAGAAEQVSTSASTHGSEGAACADPVNGALPHRDGDIKQGNISRSTQGLLTSTFLIFPKKQWKTLYRSNQIRSVQCRKVQGPIQLHTSTWWWAAFNRR